MKKFLTFIFVLALTGVASAGAEYLLIPSATCTEKACPPQDPCCNSCQFQGWFDREFNVKAVSKDPAKPLPTCDLDGCGVCPFMLQAKGKPDNFKKPKVLYVTKWSKVDNAEKDDPQEFPVFSTSPQMSEEERKKAVDDWMKDMKKQSDANMEKLKKENPEQYQKLEQFMNMLKNAAPAGTPSSSEQGK